MRGRKLKRKRKEWGKRGAKGLAREGRRRGILLWRRRRNERVDLVDLALPVSHSFRCERKRKHQIPRLLVLAIGPKRWRSR